MVVGPIEAIDPGRVELAIDGEDVWFTCDDVALTASPHAAAAASLLVAGLSGRTVEIDVAVDARFAWGMRLLDRTVSGWWGARVDHRALRVRRRADRTPTDRRRPGGTGGPRGPQGTGRRGRGTFLFFTGGVDSFHALLTHTDEIDALVFVHGFDVDIEDTERAAAAEASVREVAAATGLDAVVVRTNLRTIEAYRSTDWGRTHGGALAAVAHLLTGSYDRAMVASSYAWQADRPWGSHWRIDRRWGSSGLRIDHVDHGYARAEKVRRIVDDPLVQRHLLVCWQRRGAPGNCLECPKCVMTMAMVEHFGRLDDFSSLQPRGDLEARFAALDPDALYAPSLELIGQGTSEIAALARSRVAEGPTPAPPTKRWRRVADLLGLP